jgi:hypothetical protein
MRSKALVSWISGKDSAFALGLAPICSRSERGREEVARQSALFGTTYTRPS